ncbi:MAG: VapC toxin family PIN domain ribonuclease [Actinomycetota bacterium]|nr:VapC toxin family PIN domain ribonuclease [Actinomycetota bacterium]
MTEWLIDKSALWKLPRSPDYPVWLDRINRGQIWGCLPTRLEVAVSARDPEHWPVLRQDLLAPLLEAHATPRSEAIAMEIMDALVAARLHRSVPLPDVLIASIAVAARLTVLHDDSDFNRIHQEYGAPVVERLKL